MTAHDVKAKRRAFRHLPMATIAAYQGMPTALAWAAIKETPDNE
jgi:hypothetical protein